MQVNCPSSARHGVKAAPTRARSRGFVMPPQRMAWRAALVCRCSHHELSESDASTPKPADVTPAPRRSPTLWEQWRVGLAALVLAGGLAGGLTLAPYTPPPAWAETAVLEAAEGSIGVMKAPPQLERMLPQLLPDELNNIRIFQANTPCVVNIVNVRLVRNGVSVDAEKMSAGLGSGFVWDHDGHIVTNFHVIRGANEVKVTFLDQTVYTAKVVGADPDKDVAVLKLELSPEELAALKPVTLGSSEDLLVGQRVYAIGNPFGLDHTMTQGIVSGLGRELNGGLASIKNVIQIDAAINPGNSGGILMDSRGYVIGINTAIADPTGKGSSSGVGFAIPISDVKGLVQQILTTGRVSRPALGITIAPPQIVQQLGVEGVLVLDVPAGSPAAKAGIKGTYREYNGALVLGDIITSIDGKRVAKTSDLFNILDERKVGQTIKVDVLRGPKKLTLELTLGERQLGLAE